MLKKTTAFILAAVCIFALPHLLSLRPLIVLSGSMEPAIRTGSLIFTDTKKKTPQPGDIITFSLPMAEGREMLITHRVVRIEDGYIVTKGDANETEDYFRIEPGQILGTCIFRIPYAGYVISDIRQALNKIYDFMLRTLSRRNSLHEQTIRIFSGSGSPGREIYTWKGVQSAICC